MPWNWQGRGRKSVEEGGAVGTVDEATQGKTWPTYTASYLASRLARPGGKEQARDAAEIDKYDVSNLPSTAAKLAYLNRVTADYKVEADECLKAEFSQWLTGQHYLNDANKEYPNNENAPQRKYVFYGQRTGHGGGVPKNNVTIEPGVTMEKWKPTWWGTGTLTHLPGVREYLREDAMKANENDLALNMLAEFGPQNLEQAWAYFKHWVKGRPLSEATCLSARKDGGDVDPSRTYRPSDAFYDLRNADRVRADYARAEAEEAAATEAALNAATGAAAQNLRDATAADAAPTASTADDVRMGDAADTTEQLNTARKAAKTLNDMKQQAAAAMGPDNMDFDIGAAMAKRTRDDDTSDDGKRAKNVLEIQEDVAKIFQDLQEEQAVAPDEPPNERPSYTQAQEAQFRAQTLEDTIERAMKKNQRELGNLGDAAEEQARSNRQRVRTGNVNFSGTRGFATMEEVFGDVARASAATGALTAERAMLTAEQIDQLGRDGYLRSAGGGTETTAEAYTRGAAKNRQELLQTPEKQAAARAARNAAMVQEELDLLAADVSAFWQTYKSEVETQQARPGANSEAKQALDASRKQAAKRDLLD